MVRDLRWQCGEGRCYRQLMPKLGAFDGCFPGKIAMTDIDGAVEVNGFLLFLEWKAPGGVLSKGQSIMFERMTALSPKITVIVASGEPREPTVERIQVFRRGKSQPPEACNVELLKDRVTAWASAARQHRTRPSRRAA